LGRWILRSLAEQVQCLRPFGTWDLVVVFLGLKPQALCLRPFGAPRVQHLLATVARLLLRVVPVQDIVVRDLRLDLGGRVGNGQI
jgi:hypothetical protein